MFVPENEGLDVEVEGGGRERGGGGGGGGGGGVVEEEVEVEGVAEEGAGPSEGKET